MVEGTEAQQNERLENKVGQVGWNNNRLKLLEGLRRSPVTTSKGEGVLEAPGWMK